MATESMLDKLDRGKTPSDPDLTKALARLVNGQRWLVREWHRERDQAQWDKDDELLWKSYNAWDRLEMETRAKWKLKTCVIGPAGCDDKAPIRCDYCAGTIQFRVVVCTRDSRSGRPPMSTEKPVATERSSKVEDADRADARSTEIEGDGGKQAALFDRGNPYH